MKFQRVCIAILCLALAAVTPPVPAEAQHSDSLQIDQEQYVEGHSAYIEGIEQFENENYREAVESLSTAFSKLPGQSGIAYALSDAHRELGDLSNALYYGKRAVDLEPQNKWYHFTLAEIYRSMGNMEKEIETLQSIREHHPEDTGILNRLADAYAHSGEYLKSNELYNRLLRTSGSPSKIRLKRLENFNQLEMRDSAIVELKELRNLEPENLSAMQALSRYYLELNEHGKAKKVLKEGLSKNGRDSETLVMLAEIYLEESKWDSMSTALGNVISDPVIEPGRKLTVIRSLLTRFREATNNKALFEVTSSLVESLIRHEPGYAQAHALAADFFVSTGQTEQALKALEKTNQLQPSEDEAWRQRLRLLIQQQQFKNVIEIASLANEHVPQDPIIFYFWGNALMAEQQYQSAVDKLTTATNLPARRSFKTAVFTSLADAYAQLDRWEKAFETYEQALKLDPKNDAALNNYAYYLSVNGLQLDKAEEMALKAVEQSGAGSRSTYLDTAGWVYYQKGEYRKALNYLMESVKTGTPTANVMEHLGEVHDKLDNPEKAREWWRKALEKDSTRIHLREKINR